jgi:hypothetical protein
MDEALADWELAIDEWEKAAILAGHYDANFKALKGSEILARINSGSSATKAESEFYSSPKFPMAYNESVDLNVAAEAKKKKIDLARSRFDKFRSEFSASRNV